MQEIETFLTFLTLEFTLSMSFLSNIFSINFSSFALSINVYIFFSCIINFHSAHSDGIKETRFHEILTKKVNSKNESKKLTKNSGLCQLFVIWH